MEKRVNRQQIDRIYQMRRNKKLRQIKKWIFSGKVDTISIYRVLQKYNTKLLF